MQYRVITTIAIALLLGINYSTCRETNYNNNRIANLQKENADQLRELTRLSGNQSSILRSRDACIIMAEHARLVVEKTKHLEEQVKKTKEACESICCDKRKK